MSSVTPWNEMLSRLMQRRFFLEWAESQRPDLVPLHLRTPVSEPARILSFARPGSDASDDKTATRLLAYNPRDRRESTMLSPGTGQLSVGAEGRPAPPFARLGFDALESVRSAGHREAATDRPLRVEGNGEPPTAPVHWHRHTEEEETEEFAPPSTPLGWLRRWRAARDLAAGLWPQLILIVLLGTVLLWGSLSALGEGRLGTAFASAAIGAGLLLLGSAPLTDGRAVAYLLGAGAVLGLIGFAFLFGMFAGHAEPLGPVDFRWPW